MGNSMYDKNEIEDSLEFCRQIKEYEDISATDKGTANESQDKSLSVMAEEMETQSHSWDHILQEQDPVSVDFDAVKPFIAPPEPETSAKAMGGLLEKEEEAKRIQEKQREQARQKALARAEAAKKANEEAVRLKAEQERKAAEEAARLKAESEAGCILRSAPSSSASHDTDGRGECPQGRYLGGHLWRTGSRPDTDQTFPCNGCG